MPPGVNQSQCSGTQICVQNWPNVFGWDDVNGKAYVLPGATCAMVGGVTQGCAPAVNICPDNAIYHAADD